MYNTIMNSDTNQSLELLLIMNKLNGHVSFMNSFENTSQMIKWTRRHKTLQNKINNINNNDHSKIIYDAYMKLMMIHVQLMMKVVVVVVIIIIIIPTILIKFRLNQK